MLLMAIYVPITNLKQIEHLIIKLFSTVNNIFVSKN